MIEEGKTLQQRYRIDRQIGQGGMGAVYVATDQRFGSTVAIKETLCMDENFRKAIEREARLLNSLKHPALPRVSDHFEEDNGQFLVMEYIAGDDVGSMLDPDHHKFSVENVLKWADQLLDALDYLHNQELPVIHRDIKPQNLKINPRGDMILLDFGLAKGNPTDAGHNTAAKSIFGYSRNYASLEQIQGTGTDPRSDLYSLAATLYHLLTNSAPDDALTRAMAVLSNRPDPLLPANALDPAIPRGVAGLLLRAMALNADERPESAAEMRQMLREHEKYGYLVDDITVVGKATGAALFGQATKIMPGSTMGGAQPTEAKTEVLATGGSEDLTSVRRNGGGAAATNAGAANFVTASPKRRGKSLAAAGMVLLGVAGVVCGGLYLSNPGLFVSPSVVQPQALNGAVEPPVEAPKAQTATEDVPAANLVPIQGAVTAAEGQHSTTNTRPPETAKNNKAQPSSDPDSGPAEADIPDVDIPEVDVRDVPGGIDIVKTVKGKTTVTHVNTGPQHPFPVMPDMEKALSGIDRSKLTPEQRRKLQMLMLRTRKPPGANSPRTPDERPPDQ